MLFKIREEYPLNYLLTFRDFLPRGSGIVTRRPLILQLINSNTGKLMTFCMIIFEMFEIKKLVCMLFMESH